jgi:hypothetical protein
MRATRAHIRSFLLLGLRAEAFGYLPEEQILGRITMEMDDLIAALASVLHELPPSSSLWWEVARMLQQLPGLPAEVERTIAGALARGGGP